MRDTDCVSFLQWALPRLGFRWPGFRKVRHQVCKRIGRRLGELGLADLQQYRAYLADHPEEWEIVDGSCRITISRFGRDRRVFEVLGTVVLPRLAGRVLRQGSPTIRVWSAGCGAGEEPYSLALIAEAHSNSRVARAPIRILATDADGHQLDRARCAEYPASALRELPSSLRERGFEPLEEDTYRLRDRFRGAVEFRLQDLRRQMPAGPFQLILCRNLTFTYFEVDLQLTVLSDLLARLAAGGYLVVGSHEQLPSGPHRLSPLPECDSIYEAPVDTPRDSRRAKS